jgi:hypothetical protein
MKKSFVFILASVILVSCLVSEEYDIRKLKWGMSFEEVQAIEGLGSNFYKEEELLGIKVEVLFGCDNKGLYSVSYTTRETTFAEDARKVMVKKYGEPKSGLDYALLVKIKDMLDHYPDAVMQVLENNDFSTLANVKGADSAVNEKKIIASALAKRDMWEFGNTTALLLKSIEGASLTYWSKTYHNESKKKFEAFLEELKKKAKKVEKKKNTEGDKF